MKELVSQNHYQDPAIVAAAESAKARIQAAYLVAINKKRDVDESRDRILRACKRPGFAERVEFSKPVGGKQIKGPSIRFAELALREWGNIMTDVQVLYEDESIRRCKVMVVDLETNASFSKEIQITKTVERSKAADREVVGERTNTNGSKVYIVKATEDEIQNKEAAQISKALRNEGLRVMPSDIIDEALDTARATLRDRDKKDPDASKKAILDSFSEIGVKPRDIAAYLKHSTDTIQPAELQDLRGIYRAIRDGEARWADYVTVEGKEPLPHGKEPKTDAEKIAAIKAFDESIPNNIDTSILEEFLTRTAESNKSTVEEVKIEGAKNTANFWKIYKAFEKQIKVKKEKESSTETAPAPCPDNPEITYTKEHCDKCGKREGCPVWK